MAIKENRLNPDSIASLTRVDFNTKEEIVKSTDSSESTETESASILDKKPNVNTSPVAEAQGIHKSPGNDKYGPRANMSKGVKTKLANTSNDRDFTSGKLYDNTKFGNLGSGLDISTPKVDEYLENTKELDTSHDILSGKSERKIDELVKIELGGIKLGKYGLKQSDIANSVKSKLVASMNGFAGTTGMNKLNLDNLINSCLKDGLSFDFNIGDFDFLSMLVNASFLDMISCAGIDKATGMITDMMGDSPEGRYMMMGSIKNSLNKNNDDDVVNKLLLTKVIMDRAESDKERDTLSIQSRGITGRVLNNLDESEYKTNSSSSDYNNITSGLDALDPNWKKDENGNSNYYKVRDNKKMNGLARNKVANKHNMPETLGGPVVTRVDDSLGIVISSTEFN